MAVVSVLEPLTRLECSQTFPTTEVQRFMQTAKPLLIFGSLNSDCGCVVALKTKTTTQNSYKDLFPENFHTQIEMN